MFSDCFYDLNLTDFIEVRKCWKWHESEKVDFPIVPLCLRLFGLLDICGLTCLDLFPGWCMTRLKSVLSALVHSSPPNSWVMASATKSTPGLVTNSILFCWLFTIKDRCLKSVICPPGKSMIFHKKETEKIVLVARPGVHQGTLSIRTATSHGQGLRTGVVQLRTSSGKKDLLQKPCCCYLSCRGSQAKKY